MTTGTSARCASFAGWGPARAYDMRVYGVGELGSMLRRAGFGQAEWYGSLAGAGKPTHMTPLVVVAHSREPASPEGGAPRASR